MEWILEGAVFLPKYFLPQLKPSLGEWIQSDMFKRENPAGMYIQVWVKYFTIFQTASWSRIFFFFWFSHMIFINLYLHVTLLIWYDM